MSLGIFTGMKPKRYSVEPQHCPKCGGKIAILPTAGGLNTGELTQYAAFCYGRYAATSNNKRPGCGFRRDLGSLTGRRDSATREWNRYAKSVPSERPSK